MTLAQARRQVWTRRIIGVLLMALAMIFLILTLVKHVYLTPSGLFFVPDWGTALPRRIDPILDNWPVLALLWRVIPPWQTIPTVLTTPRWDYVYAIWGAMVVIGVGVALLRSARERQAQIRWLYQEIQHEAWRREVRGPGQAVPEHRGPTTVIQQGIWQQYAAPPESWYQRPWGIVSLGVVVGVVGGLLVEWGKTLLFPGAR